MTDFLQKAKQFADEDPIQPVMGGNQQQQVQSGAENMGDAAVDGGVNEW